MHKTVLVSYRSTEEVVTTKRFLCMRQDHPTKALSPGARGLPPGHSKVAAPAVLSFSNCEIATINCVMTKGFSIMILLGTP